MGVPVPIVPAVVICDLTQIEDSHYRWGLSKKDRDLAGWLPRGGGSHPVHRSWLLDRS